ncbi:MAG: hypothetical protein GX625_13070 [Clostridiaceae bacterium]|nr:hypothetical protein [Clostridiaceae bacterium]
MKKFVIVMIAAIVLFLFLMLNYLVWDKENLQNQRESDKLEQDWLRGQNRTLSSTVNELEQINKKLESEIASQKEEISDLELKLRSARQKEANNLQEIQKQTEALNTFKSVMEDDVKKVTENWFLSITQKSYHDSLAFLDKDFTLWDQPYEENEYIEFISNIQSISIAKENSSTQGDVFTIIYGGEPHVIQANLLVDAYIAEDAKKNLPNLVNGSNTLEVGFIYNSESKTWVIMYVITKK